MKIRILQYVVIVGAMLAALGSNAQVTWYWSKEADSASEFASYDAVDRNNNAYYTGYFSGGTRVSFGSFGLGNSAFQSDFLVKYNSNGIPLWARNARALAASVSTYGMSVATDRSNNVLETGYYNDSIAFAAFHLTARAAPSNAYLVKYDPSGNVIWATSPTYNVKPVNDQAYSVACDKENNVLVTGNFQDTLIFGKDTLSSKEIDMFLVKYGPAGNVLWAKAPFPKNASTSMYGSAVAVDDSGNTYVAGTFTDSVVFGAITIVTNPITMNIFLVKYDSAGNVKWAKDIPATPGGVYPTPVTVDNTGNVYVAAQFNNISLTLGPSTVTDGASPCSNSLVAKYDHNGNVVWATCAKYISSDEVCVIVESSLATDRCNNVYWSGVCSDTFAVGKVNITVPGANTHLSRPFGYIIKLDSNGTALGGAGIANQTTQYFSNGLAVDSFTRVFYDGAFSAPASLTIGIDTLKRYLTDATSFISKFSIGQQINTKGRKDTICPGDSILISVFSIPGTTYKWSTGATTDSIYVKPLSTTAYFVITSTTCIVDTSFVTIAVTSIKVKITGTDSVCKGDTLLLTGSGGGTYAWSTGATTSTIKVSPPSNTTYTLTVSNGVCSKDTTFSVKVLPIPTPLITVKPSNDTICSGDSAMLVGSGANSYFWPVPGSSKDTIWVKPGSTTTYQLQASNGICTATISQKIVVLTNKIVNLTLRSDSICPNDSTYLVASGGISYKWSPGGATTDSIKVKPGTTTTYTVYVVNSCGKDTLSKTLHIVFPIVSTSGNTAICKGNSTNISAGGGTSYVWSPGGSTNATVNVIPTKTTTYTVAVSNGRCFKDTTITVTVDTLAVSSIPDIHLCYGDSTIITASGGTSYKWNNGATTSSIRVKPGSTTTYTCVVTKGPCVDSVSPKVVVDVPTLFACCDTIISLGGSATIRADSATNYLWSPNSSLSCDSCPTPVATPSVTTTYTVLTTDTKGCTVERKVTVFVETPCADFTVPNIFTPNDDGRNDDFVINVLNPSSYTINIFDRWGKEVYTSSDPTVYWNGKLLNTQYLVPDGVYYYIIKASCGNNNYLKKGFVQVVGEQ